MSPQTEFAANKTHSALAARLAQIHAFRDLAEDDRVWVASLMTEQDLSPGDALVFEGSPADRMFVIFEGELRARRDTDPDGPDYLIQSGDVSGMLPFSRMREFPLTVRASTACRLAVLQTSHFDAMLGRLPELGRALVGVMSDRIRAVAHEDLHRDKLAAIGRLSAGLAHELNNPAAAVLRALDAIRSSLAEWQAATVRLEDSGLTPEQRRLLAECERECVADLRTLPALDSLAQSDREEALATLLSQRGIRDPWSVSQALVDGGFEPDDLACVSGAFPASALNDVLIRFASTLTMERLLTEASRSARRISELVRSMKEYSFMDQGHTHEVDLHRGIENTLAILQYRIPPDVRITREYDETVPTLIANGNELNQVWTNLIENALDAIGPSGSIQIRTRRERDVATVEITDSGPGIPEQIQDRIFEPFFTTKQVGQGTGLGLDIVFRALRKHHGSIGVESRPGCTRFQVRLPLYASASGGY